MLTRSLCCAGQVWHFNAEGDASDEDDSPQDEQAGFTTDGGESAGSEIENESNTSTVTPTPTTRRASKRARTRKRDGRAIQSIFPGIRSLVFLGMWDPHQERWFGASIAVSYSSMRIFSVQSELSYIAAFCDVVLAEIWRLEAQELGRSKNDFVSSISHELRSPLGMLSRTIRTVGKPADKCCSKFLTFFSRARLMACPSILRYWCSTYTRTCVRPQWKHIHYSRSWLIALVCCSLGYYNAQEASQRQVCFSHHQCLLARCREQGLHQESRIQAHCGANDRTITYL